MPSSCESVRAAKRAIAVVRRGRVRTAGLGLALALSSGCDADAPREFAQSVRPSTAAPEPSEGDATGADDQGATSSSLQERWAPCIDQGDCLDFERCVLGSDEPKFSVCMADCEVLDDCLASSSAIQSGTDVRCGEFQGQLRCLLGCQDASECRAGMACVAGACVWP